MNLITEILSVKILLLIYILLALPWIFTSQTRVRRLFGAKLSTLLNLLRCIVILVVIFSFAGLTVLLPRDGGNKRVVLLEDRSLSMILPESSEGASTRRDRAAMLAEEIKSLLGAEWEIDRLWFGETAVKAGDELGEESVSGSTDISRSLREASSLSGEESSVIMVSDGRVTLGRSGPYPVRDSNTPVHSVMVGDELAVFDASITSIAFREPVYQDEDLTLNLLLSGYGPGEGEVEIEVRLDGESVEKNWKTITGNGTSTNVSYSIPSMQPGTHLVEVLLNVEGEEFTGLNNRRSFYLEVKKSKRLVALYSNSPDWDFTFLKRHVETFPEYEARVFVETSAASLVGLEAADRSYDAGRASEPFFDAFETSGIVVLHGDMTLVPPDIRGAVYRRFRAGGIGLILMPTVPWQSGSSWGDLAALCPYPRGVEDVTTIPGAVGMRGATAHPVVATGLGSGFDEWEELPPFLNFLTGVGVADGFTEILGSGVTGDLKVPVLLAIERDGARGLALLSGGFWQWDMFPVQYGKGPYFKKLSQGMFEWLSEPSLFLSAACEPSARSLRMGDGIRFIRSGSLEGWEPIEVEIVNGDRADSVMNVLILEGEDAESRKLFLPPGHYHYTTRELGGEGESFMPADEGSFLVDISSAEFDDPRPDRNFLEMLSRETGGAVFESGDIPSLVDELNSARGKTGKQRRIDLRRQPSTYLAVLLMFFMELILRRRRGLP
jgi:hypothetical protein